MLDQALRRVVEAFRKAHTIRIVINEGDPDNSFNLKFNTASYDAKEFKGELRRAVQGFFNTH